MSYCPKCGTKTQEGMNFCPKCGTQLRVQQPAAEAVPPTFRAAPRSEKREKEEKQEKEEKGEKEERREMREFSFAGPLIGGVFLLFLGVIFYFTIRGSLRLEAFGALLIVLIGVIIIAGAAYGAIVASRRYPRT